MDDQYKIKLHLEFCDLWPQRPQRLPREQREQPQTHGAPTAAWSGASSTSRWTRAQGRCARLSLGNKRLPTQRLTAHVYSLTGSKGQESGRSLGGPLPRVSQAAVEMPARLCPF